MSVLPTLVSSNNELYNVENEYNAVTIEGKDVGTHFYKGKGAGSYPTGAVVYSDLNAIDNGYRYSYKKALNSKNWIDNEEKVTLILSGNDSYSLKNLESDFTSFYPLDLYGKRFVLYGVIQINYDMLLMMIHCLVIVVIQILIIIIKKNH